MSATALHQQVRALLFEDPVLAACGFTHETIGQDGAGSDPHISVIWSDTWCESRSGLLGVVTIDVAGVDGRTRNAVLQRVALIIQAAPAWSATIRRVRPDGYVRSAAAPNRFTVLASVVDDEWSPSAADARAEEARDLVFLALAEDDELAAMGYRYDTIQTQFTVEGPVEGPLDTAADVLVLAWAVLSPGSSGGTRQRLHLGVHGPSARDSDTHLGRALVRAGTTLLAIGTSRPPIDSLTVASPRVRRCIGHELVTVEFDVTTP